MIIIILSLTYFNCKEYFENYFENTPFKLNCKKYTINPEEIANKKQEFSPKAFNKTLV